MDKRMWWKFAPAIAGYLILVGGFYFLVLAPLDQRAQVAALKLRQDEERLITLSARAAESGEVRQLRARADAYLAAFQRRLVPADRNQAVLGELNAICRECGVALTSLMPEKEAADAGAFQKVFWKVTLVGPYHRVGLFLNRLEKARYFLAVEDFALAPAKDGAAVQAQFTLYAFEPKAAAKRGEGNGT